MRHVLPLSFNLWCYVIVVSTALSWSCGGDGSDNLSPSGPTVVESSVQTPEGTRLTRSVFGTSDYADDYPYPNVPVDTVNSRWNFYYRECTDFVAWRMNRDAGTTTEPYFFTNTMNGGRWSNAENWAANATSPQLGYVVNSSPAVGAVAHWYRSELSDPSFPGHVAYVERVNEDGTVDITEYNYGAAHAFGFRSNIVAPRYIHVPKHSTVSLAGIVTASGSGARIAGATIRVLDGVNAGRSASTNSNGEYLLTGLSEGNANVSANASGYHEARAGVFVNGTNTLNFTLTPATSLYDGSWTGSGSGTSSGSTPASTEINLQGTGNQITLNYTWTISQLPPFPTSFVCPGRGTNQIVGLSGNSFTYAAGDDVYQVRITGTFTSPTAVSGTASFQRVGTSWPQCPSATVNWSGRKR